MVADAPREGEQVALPFDEDATPAILREYSSAERVKAELEVVGMDASRHLIDFYRPLLEDIGWTPAATLGDLRGDLVGDGGGGEGRIADPGRPQRPADHLPHA